MSMEEVMDESVHLMVISPPYFNAPFDYQGLFKSYGQLAVLKLTGKDGYNEEKLSARQRKLVRELTEEAKENNFEIDIQ